MGEPNRLDVTSPQPEFLEHEVVYEVPETVLSLALPDPLECAKAGSAELPRRLGSVELEIWIALVGEPSAEAAEPIELLDLLRRQTPDVRVPNRRRVKGPSAP